MLIGIVFRYFNALGWGGIIYDKQKKDLYSYVVINTIIRWHGALRYHKLDNSFCISIRCILYEDSLCILVYVLFALTIIQMCVASSVSSLKITFCQNLSNSTYKFIETLM